MSERVELTALYPERPGEDAGKWTGRVLSHAKDYGTNRQCSIGWHDECSDPIGESCQCLCHDGAEWYSVEGHPEGEEQVVTRSEHGKQHWPAVEGEPEGTWAHWILAVSEADARVRAVAKQKALSD